MKQYLIIFTFLMTCVSAIFAEDSSQQEQPERTDNARLIALYLQQNDISRYHRCPSKPIYGYYDGSNLFVDFGEIKDSESLIISIHCENATYEFSSNSDEISQGIQIIVDSSFWVEIATASGITYCEITPTDE